MTSIRLLSIPAWLTIASATPCCCGVGSPGHPVQFGDQANIIVWNAATGTEHFIRNASFSSTGRDFGFIAPSPTKPELAQASRDAFSLLANLKPQPWHFELMPSSSAAAMKDVEVIQVVDVAGYHATTLLASDSKALATWMKNNGYVTTPAIEKWTQFYIAKNWYLTAFKVASPAAIASTGVVRMSFKADHPFNPYYVPKDNLGGRGSKLSLYFVSDGDYVGSIGRSQAWQAPDWTADVPDEARSQLAQDLKLTADDIPAGARVASYIDPSFPRDAADDIYFAPAPGYIWPVGIGLGLTAGIAISYWASRRRRTPALTA